MMASWRHRILCHSRLFDITSCRVSLAAGLSAPGADGYVGQGAVLWSGGSVGLMVEEADRRTARQSERQLCLSSLVFVGMGWSQKQHQEAAAAAASPSLHITVADLFELSAIVPCQMDVCDRPL